ncbi:hypothetical protein PAXRUDRAFT_302018 [Paxillus rubicundulus Ve08.2h10]|uniref:Uncharacterized protein n=1 Tax=Paxillus rubicundulus Ve08.2h10 TaxID=930991 RepID=A0A0D0ECZ8_9AGAM|nr:hypothetical protein PAXRUDRAFT_302018 [Paxillus rubicundulus Ve08.2h10]
MHSTDSSYYISENTLLLQAWHPGLLRSNSGSSSGVGKLDDPHRSRGAMLCPVRMSICYRKKNADHAVVDVNDRHHSDNVMTNGGSVIVSPFGKVLTGLPGNPMISLSDWILTMLSGGDSVWIALVIMRDLAVCSLLCEQHAMTVSPVPQSLTASAVSKLTANLS